MINAICPMLGLALVLPVHLNRLKAIANPTTAESQGLSQELPFTGRYGDTGEKPEPISPGRGLPGAGGPKPTPGPETAQAIADS